MAPGLPRGGQLFGLAAGAAPQGGTPPSGGPGGSPDQMPPGVDADTWAAAQEACSDLAPTPPEGDASTASPDS